MGCLMFSVPGHSKHPLLSLASWPEFAVALTTVLLKFGLGCVWYLV
jgi:hypothetical protein